MLLHPSTKLVFQTSGPYSHFFGYYDKSPLDSSGRYLLTHRVNFDGRDVTGDDNAVIGYWNIETGVFTELGCTRAFNWQQGAMLQWLPPDYSSRVIYNDRESDRFISVIVDIASKQKQIIPFPIYTVHPSGEFALGVNFERLYFCRKGYCYEGVVKTKWDCPLHEEDGIFRIDLITGETRLLVSTRQVVDMAPVPEIKQGYNWLSHCMWNRSGSRFSFLHRWNDVSQWIAPKGDSLNLAEQPFATRLLTADVTGSNIYLFPDTKFYSHMGWQSDTDFTIWGRQKDVSKNVLVKAHHTVYQKNSPGINFILSIYRGLKRRMSLGNLFYKMLIDSPAYLKMRDCSDQIEILGKGTLKEDGHNTWSPDKRFMLTDTYPDPGNRQHLLLYDLHSDRVTELGHFYAPYVRGYRCDLHPRWDHSGNYIIIDSAHENGKRQTYVFEVTFSDI